MFTAKIDISSADVANLAITAFEMNGMTASWCGSVKPACALPEGIESPWYSDAKFWDEGFQVTVTYDGPDDDEGSRASGAIIGHAEVQRGFDVMASKYPSHFGDFISGNYDSVTADVWWQCVCLGDLIYG